MDSVGNIIVYFVVAIVMVVFSFKAVTTGKILRAATYLLFVLLGTAVFYFQLGYQFLGAVQIAVYAGGIMVLFVFAILLTHLMIHRAASGRTADRSDSPSRVYPQCCCSLHCSICRCLTASLLQSRFRQAMRSRCMR